MPRMTPARLAAIAEVCTDAEVQAEIDAIPHTCHLNGGVECWKCDIDEAAE